MAKVPVLGNDPFLQGAASRTPEPSSNAKAGGLEKEMKPAKAGSTPKKPPRRAKRPEPAPAAQPPAEAGHAEPPAAPAPSATESAAEGRRKPPRKAPETAPHPASAPAPPGVARPNESFTEESAAGVPVEEKVYEGEVVFDFPHRPQLPRPSALQPVPAGASGAQGWLARLRLAATGLAEQTMQAVLSNSIAQGAVKTLAGNALVRRVAETALRAASATRPALDAALRLMPPAAGAARSMVSSVVSGEAGRALVTTAAEAGLALQQAIRRSEPQTGDVDAFGEDPSVLSRAEPMLDFLHERYFRIEALGADRVPEGASLLICNHAGVVPIDGLMIRTVLRRDCRRSDCRWLIEDSLFHAPVIGTLLNRLGAVRACPENAARLLEQGVPLAVFPEGRLGVSKRLGQRYQLQRFGRGGFVKLALRCRVPLVPVAIVGAEEASPLLAKIPIKAFGVSSLPLTPTFPFLGPLGLLPFPTKWTVSFLEPIHIEGHEPEDADDPAFVARWTAEIRESIQQELDRLLSRRRSVFSG